MQRCPFLRPPTICAANRPAAVRFLRVRVRGTKRLRQHSNRSGNRHSPIVNKKESFGTISISPREFVAAISLGFHGSVLIRRCAPSVPRCIFRQVQSCHPQANLPTANLRPTAPSIAYSLWSSAVVHQHARPQKNNRLLFSNQGLPSTSFSCGGRVNLRTFTSRRVHRSSLASF